MIYLLKNINCYSPGYIGKKDIWIANDKIIKIREPDDDFQDHPAIDTIVCDNLTAFPGIIDGHVHITGGGGEEGFSSRIGEMDCRDIFLAGVTTVVGLLGADNQTKSLKALLAKAKALETEGLTTFIYSGSYEIPIVTFTGDITSDMALVDKVVGAGEVAIADHRSSHPDMRVMLDLASKTHLGGLISGKAGLLHLHIGDGKQGLGLLEQILKESDLPAEMFLPTHVNRNPGLFRQAVRYAKNGGNIDLTCGEETGVPVPDAIRMLLDSGVDMQRVTVSSDAGGSIPSGGAGKIQSLYRDIVDGITQKNIDPEIMFSLVTEHAARRIGQYPVKGTISEGGDADLLIVDNNYQLQKLFCMGKLMVDRGELTAG